MAEMQVIFQFVAVEIILTVEVQRCLLFGTENIVKICYAYSAVNYPVHLVCRDTVGRDAAYTVDVSPEALLKRTVVEESAEVLHRMRRITVEQYSSTLSKQLWNIIASSISAIALPIIPVCRRETQYFRLLSITSRSATTFETA